MSVSRKKPNASLLAAQASFFAENNIPVPKVHVEDKKGKKKSWIDDVDVSKLGLAGDDMQDYIAKIHVNSYSSTIKKI